MSLIRPRQRNSTLLLGNLKRATVSPIVDVGPDYTRYHIPESTGTGYELRPMVTSNRQGAPFNICRFGGSQVWEWRLADGTKPQRRVRLSGWVVRGGYLVHNGGMDRRRVSRRSSSKTSMRYYDHSGNFRGIKNRVDFQEDDKYMRLEWWGRPCCVCLG